MRARYSGLIVSAVISLASLGLAYYPGLRMGVEFAGGIVIEARAPTPVHAALRDKLGGLGLGPVQVQEFGSPNDVLLRLEHPHGSSSEQQAAIAKARNGVQEALPGSEIRRVEVVGPTIGSELSRVSVALLLAIVPLALFGGPALREFAVVLLFGLVLATSSSIFIAAPILLNLGEKRLTGRRIAEVGAILPARNSRSPQTAGRQA